MLISKRIKFKNKLYNIKASAYDNGRLKLIYYDKKETQEITIDVDDAYIKDGHIFLDPIIMHNGFYKLLKKNKIIREIVGVLNDQYVEIPIAQVNMGILKSFDKSGVNDFLNERRDFY